MSKQLLFIKFPILFPIIYGSVLYIFPQYETELILITILLLAETHFGATWPFFLSKSNVEHILNDKIKLFFFPVLIIIFSLIGFFFFKNLFLMIFFMANIYHVTRQSFGVCKLYAKKEEEINFQEKFIYIFNFVFFIIAFFRFYYPVFDNFNLLYLNLIVLLLIFCTSILYIIKFSFSENFLTFITGVIIFYPTCFVSNPVHAIIMGVTMHYSQYLYLTSYVVESRKNDDYLNTGKKASFLSNFLFVVVVYSIIMTFFSTFGKSQNISLSNLIIIPIVGQMLHFYLDSQLWKFSIHHNRENVLKYILKFIK